MKKKIVILFLMLAAFSLILISGTDSKTMPYYSGDAITYNNRIFIGSTNAKTFELFAFDNNKIVKQAIIVSPSQFGSADNYFLDSQFKIEENKLFVYLIDGRYLYKYDLAIPAQPKLIKQIKDNTWDWFIGLNIAGNNLATIGKKGIKIWDNNMQVINTYNMTNLDYPYNLSFSQNGDYIFNQNGFIFNIDDDNLKIYSVSNQEEINISLINSQKQNIRVYNDPVESLIYLVDNESLKAYDFNGNLKKEFKHTSNKGYEVARSANAGYLYFTDGIGVVKSRKNDLEPIKWAHTTDLGTAGGWAMGLEVEKNSSGEKVIIFNNSSILVLDDNLKMLDSYKAIEKDYRPQEDLSLGVDKFRGAPGAYLSLHGQGYAANEDLQITFVNNSILAKADENGRFTKIIQVPSALPGRTYIKVLGKISGLHYSISFDIE